MLIDGILVMKTGMVFDIKEFAVDALADACENQTDNGRAESRFRHWLRDVLCLAGAWPRWDA